MLCCKYWKTPRLTDAKGRTVTSKTRLIGDLANIGLKVIEKAAAVSRASSSRETKSYHITAYRL